MPAQLTAADYVPGSVIDTPELLRAVLAHEDGVWIEFHAGETPILMTAEEATLHLSGWTAQRDRLLAQGRIRRALVRCPQTAEEMRTK